MFIPCHVRFLHCVYACVCVCTRACVRDQACRDNPTQQHSCADGYCTDGCPNKMVRAVSLHLVTCIGISTLNSVLHPLTVLQCYPTSCVPTLQGYTIRVNEYRCSQPRMMTPLHFFKTAPKSFYVFLHPASSGVRVLGAKQVSNPGPQKVEPHLSYDDLIDFAGTRRGWPSTSAPTARAPPSSRTGTRCSAWSCTTTRRHRYSGPFCLYYSFLVDSSAPWMYVRRVLVLA